MLLCRGEPRATTDERVLLWDDAVEVVVNLDDLEGAFDGAANRDEEPAGLLRTELEVRHLVEAQGVGEFGAVIQSASFDAQAGDAEDRVERVLSSELEMKRV